MRKWRRRFPIHLLAFYLYVTAFSLFIIAGTEYPSDEYWGAPNTWSPESYPYSRVWGYALISSRVRFLPGLNIHAEVLHAVSIVAGHLSSRRKRSSALDHGSSGRFILPFCVQQTKSVSLYVRKHMSGLIADVHLLGHQAKRHNLIPCWIASASTLSVEEPRRISSGLFKRCIVRNFSESALVENLRHLLHGYFPYSNRIQAGTLPDLKILAECSRDTLSNKLIGFMAVGKRYRKRKNSKFLLRLVMATFWLRWGLINWAKYCKCYP